MENSLEKPKNGDLKVWWIPEIPMKAFEFPVNTLQEAFTLLKALAEYDEFQFENNIRPDYSNAGGLIVFDEFNDEWCEWYSEDGDDIEYYLNSENGYELLTNDLKK